MYNKTIIEFGFCDIQNNQGLGKCNQPRLIKPRSRRLGGFLLRLRFIYLFFFSFVGEQTQTPDPLSQLLSLDDVTISQLQAISQLFSSYPPQEHFVKLAN